METPDTPIAATPSAELGQEWALVLTATDIGHRLEPTPAGWTLLVRATDADRAARELADYEAERRSGTPIEGEAVPAGGPWLGAAVAGLLTVFFAITGPWARRSVWFEGGAAAAALILDGEPWRVVTALTLHADLAHVLGNALACLVLVTAVGRLLGPGLGLWLVLLAGAGGNALAAIAHGPLHVSVGASTSTFGALGILAALQITGWRRPAASRRAWVVGTTSLILLVLLGAADRADVLAHAFGLAVGGALGLVAALALPHPPGRPWQGALLLAAAASVIACWTAAVSTLSWS
jgi:rhomboid protease GluP